MCVKERMSGERVFVTFGMNGEGQRDYYITNLSSISAQILVLSIRFVRNNESPS